VFSYRSALTLFKTTVADGESLLALCYRTEVGPNTPPATLWVSTTVADKLDRKPYATKHGQMFEDTRSEDEIIKATKELTENARPVVAERGSKGEAKGKLLWILVVVH
jgi:hypothetical protein